MAVFKFNDSDSAPRINTSLGPLPAAAYFAQNLFKNIMGVELTEKAPIFRRSVELSGIGIIISPKKISP